VATLFSNPLLFSLFRDIQNLHGSYRPYTNNTDFPSIAFSKGMEDILHRAYLDFLQIQIDNNTIWPYIEIPSTSSKHGSMLTNGGSKGVPSTAVPGEETIGLFDLIHILGAISVQVKPFTPPNCFSYSDHLLSTLSVGLPKHPLH
jgi:hypothetical protein